MKIISSSTMSKFIYLIALMWSYSPHSFTQSVGSVAQSEEDYFEIIDIPIPEDVLLEVGGMTNLPNGNIAICTRRGEVWVVSNTENYKPTFKRYAHGLHEPLGIAYKDGALYVAQRGELTRLVDRNVDGIADLYEKVTSWPLSGNYHEYSYGPALLPNGNFMVTLNLGWVDRLGRMESLVPWRGWVVEVTPSGKIIPYATGLRSPAGYWVNDQGEFFYSENQGDWVGSGRISHVQKGDFLGNPKGLKWANVSGLSLDLKPEEVPDTEESMVKVAQEVPELRLPAVWLPHGIMGSSTAGFLFDDTEGNFGPFAGHIFIGDQGQSKIMRMDMELVNGEYQGVIFPFMEGFSSGVFRMIWGSDASMLVGMTSRGWSSTGGESYGLQKVIWKGSVPFEMKTVKANPDGFLIEFTQPVDRGLAADLSSYEITNFNYKYRARYGSPVIEKGSCPIRSVNISDDGLKVNVVVDSLKLGYIHEIKIHDVVSYAGKSLLHNVGYYTLNNIPEDKKEKVDHKKGSADMRHLKRSNVKMASTVKKETTKEVKSQAQFKSNALKDISNKRETNVPEHWNGHIDQTMVIGTKPGLKYDIERMTFKAGSRVRLVFQNNDDMLHNLVIVLPGSAIEVGEMALKLGLDGQGMNYIPDSDKVLFYTHLLEPNKSETIYFRVPEKPGEYEYVCTVPGHYYAMRGIIKVIE